MSKTCTNCRTSNPDYRETCSKCGRSLPATSSSSRNQQGRDFDMPDIPDFGGGDCGGGGDSGGGGGD